MLRLIQLGLFILIASGNLLGQYETYMTVALDGSGDYTSIQEAINNTKSFPDQDITIYVKKGVYREKVRMYPWNSRLTLRGEDREETIITWDDHFKKINQGRNSTFLTYTLSVEANDVTIENLTIRNSAGAVGQAIALAVEGDRVIILNCRIEGHQDTLYVTGAGSRQYFKNCFITGTTDFIFGNATAFFEQCTIHSLSNSFITAASTDSTEPYGLVFFKCILSADPEVDSVFLGRPWRSHAHTAFIECQYGDHIRPAGWDDWGNPSNRQTARYEEYAPNHPLAGRVDWIHIIPVDDLVQYNKQCVLQGWTMN